jgi:D-aminopeptidase
MLNDARIDALYEAVIDAVEESILNAMLASPTMTGRNGNTVHGLPHDLLLEALQAGDGSMKTSST